MLATIIAHELKNILFSPKFSVTVAVASVLLLLSVVAGIGQYRAAAAQYETTTQLVQQEMREARGWMGLTNKVLRRPDPMQIFVSGVANDVGRLSGVNAFQAVKLSHSTFSDDPVYAVFRFIDLSFIVAVVFSLLAVLFTYDAVNGEKERGTLQLTFANAVPRAQYILGKFAGAWLGLVLPLLVPMLLSLLLLAVTAVPMTAEEWGRTVLLFGGAVLYVTVFVALGILLSTLTPRSSASFLYALVLWVCVVFIVPRAGTTLAGHLVPVPTVAETEARQDAFAKDRWVRYESQMQSRWKERNAPLEGMTREEREAYRDEKMWEWMEQDDQDRKQVQTDIDEQARRLTEELRNRRTEQERLAFTLSRLSPASSFQLAAMNLAGTDIALKTRYEDALNDYRTLFNEYKEKKAKESGNSGGFRIEVNSDTGVKIDAGRERGVLDLTGMPQFAHPSPSAAEMMRSAFIDLGLLGLFSLAAFAGAFVRFLRYDVR